MQVIHASCLFFVLGKVTFKDRPPVQRSETIEQPIVVTVIIKDKANISEKFLVQSDCYNLMHNGSKLDHV